MSASSSTVTPPSVDRTRNEIQKAMLLREMTLHRMELLFEERLEMTRKMYALRRNIVHARQLSKSF